MFFLYKSGCIRGGVTGLKGGGGLFGKNPNFLAEKIEKIPNFGAAGAKILGKIFDFLRKIMIFRHKMIEIALKTLKMQ